MMRIGIIGCGFIGKTIGASLDRMSEVSEINLLDKSYEETVNLAPMIKKARIFTIEELSAFIEASDLIVEAASQEAVFQYGHSIVTAGRDLMILSVGALGNDVFWKDLTGTALRKKARIFVPSGAVSGIDGIGAAIVAGIDCIVLTVRKPPKGLSLPEELKHLSARLMDLKEPLVLFEGTAREAVRLFPRNVNVAATIAVAGIGFDRTMVNVIADPVITRNSHTIEVRGRFGEMTVEMSNTPSTSNPRTSYLAPLSALAMIKKIATGVYIGS
jgi:aspartate dehydrogenase